MHTAERIWTAAITLSLLHSQWWSREQIERFQRRRLIGILRYAADRVPFYRSLNLGSGRLNSLENLQLFPVIRKADLQARPADCLSTDFDSVARHRSKSSGATDQPTVTDFCDASWTIERYVLKARRVAWREF
jgi:phenylacetate-coenzyme A ligase PaaK-like adenylate-forming protein